MCMCVCVCVSVCVSVFTVHCSRVATVLSACHLLLCDLCRLCVCLCVLPIYTQCHTPPTRSPFPTPENTCVCVCVLSIKHPTLPPLTSPTMEADELYAVRNHFYLGNYQACVSEGNAVTPGTEALRVERDCLIYRSFIAQGNCGVVLQEVCLCVCVCVSM